VCWKITLLRIIIQIVSKICGIDIKTYDPSVLYNQMNPNVWHSASRSGLYLLSSMSLIFEMMQLIFYHATKFIHVCIVRVICTCVLRPCNRKWKRAVWNSSNICSYISAARLLFLDDLIHFETRGFDKTRIWWKREWKSSGLSDKHLNMHFEIVASQVASPENDSFQLCI
jgi:hypothetical protein